MESAHATVSDSDIDAVIAEFDGDIRKALGALLHDLGVLAADQEVLVANVSTGFMRRRQPVPPQRVISVTVTERQIVAAQR